VLATWAALILAIGPADNFGIEATPLFAVGGVRTMQVVDHETNKLEPTTVFARTKVSNVLIGAAWGADVVAALRGFHWSLGIMLGPGGCVPLSPGFTPNDAGNIVELRISAGYEIRWGRVNIYTATVGAVQALYLSGRFAGIAGSGGLFGDLPARVGQAFGVRIVVVDGVNDGGFIPRGPPTGEISIGASARVDIDGQVSGGITVGFSKLTR
jgi:hypothetical protein